MTEEKIEIAAAKVATPAPWKILLLLVAMNGIAPISLYILVPALPILATTFASDVSAVQLNVSLFMVGLAMSQLVTGPLSDRLGRRPVLLAGLGLMVAATIVCIFAQTLPQLIAGRFLQAVGGATGMVMSRAIIRDLYPRERVGGMISLVIGVMMIAQLISPLIGGLLETSFGWRSIFYAMAGASIFVTVIIAFGLPETRRLAADGNSPGFIKDSRTLLTSRAYIGYALCQVLASSIIFTFAGGGPYLVVSQMGRTTAEYGAWFAVTGFAFLIGNLSSARVSQRYALDQLIWFGLAIQIGGALLNVLWAAMGFDQTPVWLFGTQMLVMFANAFVMSHSAAGAISVRPLAAGTASGLMGFVQMGFGALCSQFGAYLGGNFRSTLPLTISIVALSLACAATMIFLIPRQRKVLTADAKRKADEEDTGLL
ncbi:MAG: multidrug effflux MFS transporter [Afipia sp.]|nr:multidrug effflux MFS transporter [Afipia sp.]